MRRCWHWWRTHLGGLARWWPTSAMASTTVMSICAGASRISPCGKRLEKPSSSPRRLQERARPRSRISPTPHHLGCAHFSMRSPSPDGSSRLWSGLGAVAGTRRAGGHVSTRRRLFLSNVHRPRFWGRIHPKGNPGQTEITTSKLEKVK